MEKIKHCLLIFTVSVLTILSGTMTGLRNVSAAENNTVDIVFSMDIHSYLSSHSTLKDGENINIGGIPRMSTYIQEKREEYPELLLVDAGDYPMGTLYQSMYTSQAFEYRMLSKLKYDAITFGNHDFDYGTEGMALQFETAKSKCDYYPDFIICNIDWSVNDAATKRILDSMSGMNLCDYAIIEKNGMKIGITGVMGYDAISCAPTCELTFLDPVESVKKTVAEMKEKEDPDFIMVISHSGTAPEGSNLKSEDEELAKAVPDIDFIVSGHNHLVLPECIQIGDTYIGSSGCYGENMGFASFKMNDRGRFDLVDYNIDPMDESVEQDPELLDMLSDFDSIINTEFLAQYGYTSDQVIGHNNYEFSSVDDLYYVHDDHNLGQLIADAYRWKAENTDTGNSDHVTGSVAPSGTIRATFPKGDIDVAKVYEVFSLGMGLDGTVGYPLVEMYLTGDELLTVCEVDASVSPLMNSANLYLSGLDFEFNPNRMFLNKTTDASIETEIGGDESEEIDPDRLYRVVTDLYSLQMLGEVENVSHGLISLVPKNKDGSAITDYSQCVLHDEKGNEVKAWIAIADYIQHFDDDGDGIGEIPALYDNTDDRKIINDSKNITELLKNTNIYFWGIIAVVIICVLLIVLIVILAVRLILKISRQKKKEKNE